MARPGRQRTPDDEDRAAFFACSRRRLYLGALVAALGLAAAVLAFALLARIIGPWVIPLAFAAYATLVAVLMQTPAGRGFLLTFGRGYRPRTQLAAHLIFTLLSALGVLYLLHLHRH